MPDMFNGKQKMIDALVDILNEIGEIATDTLLDDDEKVQRIEDAVIESRERLAKLKAESEPDV